MSLNLRTATFLFTDLENSTPLWEVYPELMQELSVRHDALMRKAITAHRGRVVKTTGDGFHAVFDTATDGVAAAVITSYSIHYTKLYDGCGGRSPARSGTSD